MMNGPNGTAAATACVQKPSVIDEKLNQAWDTVNVLHDRVDYLTQRLMPVVNSAKPLEDKPRRDCSEMLSPLGDSLNRLSGSMGSLCDKLDAITSQLEL